MLLPLFSGPDLLRYGDSNLRGQVTLLVYSSFLNETHRYEKKERVTQIIHSSDGGCTE